MSLRDGTPATGCGASAYRRPGPLTGCAGGWSPSRRIEGTLKAWPETRGVILLFGFFAGVAGFAGAETSGPIGGDSDEPGFLSRLFVPAFLISDTRVRA